MGKVEIIPATFDHIPEITKMVRPEDREELWAAAYSTPERAMKKGIELSDFAKTGFYDGVPVCMWGVVRDDFIFNSGTPWMISTTKANDCAVTFLRRGRIHLMNMLDGYDMLVNYVDQRNTRCVDWLRFMGFTIEEAKPYGVLGLPFHRFFRRGYV